MPNPSEPLSETRRAGQPTWLPAVASAGLSLALYAVTLHGTYIFDDRGLLFDDPRIADPHLWHAFWTGAYVPKAPDNLYRPLVSLSYAVQWWLHGDRAWAFHLVNWLLAAAAAAAVAEFARRSVACGLNGSGGERELSIGASRRDIWVGLVAGLLFAAHPAHVEAVAYISGRPELLCTLGTFAGLALFLSRPLTGRRAAAIVACFFMALLSKEQGIFFPLLLAVLAFFRTPRGAVSPLERACNRWLAISLIWLETGYLLFREHILKFEWNRQWLSWAANPLIRSTGLDRWLMPLVLVGRYVVLLVAPCKLSLDYGGGVIGSSVRYHEPYFYLGIAAVLGWVVAFCISVRSALFGGRRAAIAGTAAFALIGLGLTIGMVSNLTSLIGAIFGERLAFMPSAFLAILVGLLVGGISARARRPVGIVVLALVVLGSVRTVTYARKWNDRRTLYETALAQQPRSLFLHALVYTEFKRAGDWQAARAVGEHCRQQIPEWWESWLMCFEPDIELGRLKEANDLIHEAARVCYNDGLITWAGKVGQALTERRAMAQTVPATRPK